MLYDGKQSSNNQPYNPNINNNLPVVTCSMGQKIMFIFLCCITLGLLSIMIITRKNYFKKLQIKINESASNIDVQLQKRFDTLSKLVASTKNHVNFNKELFTNIAAYRSGMDLNQKAECISKINSSLTMSFENYPELDAKESIRTLNNESIMIEKEIAASRRLYNALVTEFNSNIYIWPNNFILRNQNVSGIPLFVTEESKRKDIEINF